MAYEDIRNPDLPWGYWLTIHNVPGLPGPVVDEDGVGWTSVREAFWVGRMGMQLRTVDDLDKQLDQLAAVLTAYDRRIVSPVEAWQDIFDGAQLFASFYIGWLAGQGLTHIGNLGTDLTSEGRAVLLMLTATRSAKRGPLPFGPDHVPSAPELNAGHKQREAWFAEVTRFAARLPCRFERVTIGSQFAILLHGDGFGHRMPMRRVLWSLGLADEETRDRLFFWLAARLDRWADWGQRAWKDGAAAFTQFLLELVTIALLGPDVGQPVALLSGPLPERG